MSLLHCKREQKSSSMAMSKCKAAPYSGIKAVAQGNERENVFMNYTKSLTEAVYCLERSHSFELCESVTSVWIPDNRDSKNKGWGRKLFSTWESSDPVLL